MTDQNHKTATPQPKRPPMAKAIREFVTGMQFPPPAKRGPNPNVDLAAFVISMLQYSTGVKVDTTATCSPSRSQMAGLLHGTPSSIDRRVRQLKDLGLLTCTGRGHASTLFTFHQTSQQLPKRELATVAKPKRRQTSQLSRSALATRDSELATLDSALATVGDLWGKASGVTPLEKPKPSGGGDPPVGSSSNPKVRVPSIPAGCRVREEASDGF